MPGSPCCARELAGGRTPGERIPRLSDETKSELAIVRAAATARERYGAEAITTYIISKAATVSDLLEVCILLKEAGMWRPGTPPTSALMVVPLFETIADLEAGPDVMRAWFALPEIAAVTRGARPSGGDGRLFGQQQGRRLSDVGLEPASRQPRARDRVRGRRHAHAAVPRPRRRGRARAGGRRLRRFARSRPALSRGRIRITEQGEVIAAKFGTRGKCVHQSGGDCSRRRLLATLERPSIADAEAERFRGRRWIRCRARHSAPIAGSSTKPRASPPSSASSRRSPEIADLKIGSRPASRTKSDRIEDLRAIPLGVQLGAGAGDAARLVRRRRRAAATSPDPAAAAEMVERWPFFRTTLGNFEMVLAKSDMKIAGRLWRAGCRIATSAPPSSGRIRDGWMRAATGLLSVTGQSRLLERSPALGGVDPAAAALYRAAQPAPDRAAQAAPRRRDRPARARRHSAVDQRDRDRACATAAETIRQRRNAARCKHRQRHQLGRGRRTWWRSGPGASARRASGRSPSRRPARAAAWPRGSPDWSPGMISTLAAPESRLNG
jgi:phosphoenolpyruvate carboxylase